MHIGAEGVEDILQDSNNRLDEDVIDTDDFHIETDGNSIKKIIWKKDGSDLIKKRHSRFFCI